jgi:hypothetical protein
MATRACRGRGSAPHSEQEIKIWKPFLNHSFPLKMDELCYSHRMEYCRGIKKRIAKGE